MTGRPRKVLRYALRAVLVVVLGLAGVFGYFAIRFKYFPPTFDVPSIRDKSAYQDSALIGKAWALPVAQKYEKSLVYQSNGSVCGPSSVANAVRSFGETATESTVLSGTGKCWSSFCFGGLTLDELAEVARRNSRHKVTVIRDFDYAAFRELLPQLNDPARRYVANFHRGLLFGKGAGHHSPLGGYLEAEDLVLVLDVNADFKPWLVEPRRLFDAIDSVDSSSGKKRGLLLIE